MPDDRDGTQSSVGYGPPKIGPRSELPERNGVSLGELQPLRGFRGLGFIVLPSQQSFNLRTYEPDGTQQ
jgi:hypothetical protein